MCIACREMKDKKELIKVVKSGDKISIDQTGKMPGRGAYICNNSECHKKLNKQKLFNKTFSMNIGNEIYEEIEKIYNK